MTNREIRESHLKQFAVEFEKQKIGFSDEVIKSMTHELINGVGITNTRDSIFSFQVGMLEFVSIARITLPLTDPKVQALVYKAELAIYFLQKFKEDREKELSKYQQTNENY